jgi:hypothetical protein
MIAPDKSKLAAMLTGLSMGIVKLVSSIHNEILKDKLKLAGTLDIAGVELILNHLLGPLWTNPLMGSILARPLMESNHHLLMKHPVAFIKSWLRIVCDLNIHPFFNPEETIRCPSSNRIKFKDIKRKPQSIVSYDYKGSPCNVIIEWKGGETIKNPWKS